MCSCVQIIQNTRLVKARKDYVDSNKEWITAMLGELRSGYFDKQPTFKEWRLIAECRRSKWIIKKGEVHEYAVLKTDDAGIYNWRTKPGLDEICRKFKLWPEC